MKKYIIIFASLSILCFGAYFYNIKISADEYIHSATTGDIKYVFYPNKLSAVADGSDKITFTLESYYISECIEPPGTTGVCTQDSVGASPSNPKPVNALVIIVSTRSGLQTANTPSLFAAGIIPYLNPEDYFTDGSEYDYKDANSFFHPYIGPDGNTAFALKTTSSGPRRIMLMETILRDGAFTDSGYGPLLYFDMNFTPAPSPTTNTNAASTPPTTTTTNTNSTTPTSSTSTTASTSATPKSANNFSTTKATGQIIKIAGNTATANLPATFSVEITTINDKKPAEFELDPLFTEDMIAITGSSNLPETKLAFEIQSDPILKAEATTDTQGNWSMKVPEKLSQNLHTIYVTALSSDGQSITEKTKLTEFSVVQKQEFTSSLNEQSRQKSFFAKYGDKIILGLGTLFLAIFIGLIAQRIVKSKPRLN